LRYLAGGGGYCFCLATHSSDGLPIGVGANRLLVSISGP